MNARHIHQIVCQEKRKKLRFWKMKLKSQVRIFWQKLMFWADTFIQMPLENCLQVLRTRSRYLGAVLNLVLCVGKKSWPYDTPIRLYCKKHLGGNHAFSLHVQHKPKFARGVTAQNVFHLLRKNKTGNWLEKFCNCVLSFWLTIQKILLNYKFNKIFIFERKSFFVVVGSS